MATKTKKADELQIVEKEMAALVTLYVNCEAVFQEKLFDWMIDRQIQKIGASAKKAVEYKIGEELTAYRKRRQEIEKEYLKPYEDVPYDEANDDAYRRELSKNVEYNKLLTKEKDLWETKIPDFNFHPVKVKITDAVTKKIKKPERFILFRDKPYPVEPYAALAFLVDEGYLVETT